MQRLFEAPEVSPFSRLVVVVAGLPDENLTLLDARHHPTKHAPDTGQVLSVYMWDRYQCILKRTV